MKDNFKPAVKGDYSEIQRLPINANNFELKPTLIHMVQNNQYGGLPSEGPNAYLAIFLEICDNVKMNGVDSGIICARLFAFSLRDRAKAWLQTQPINSITSWEELAEKFLTKFFPPSKTTHLRNEITQFRQLDYEQFYEAWERFKEMLRKCPQHGFEDWFQVQLFYGGFNVATKAQIDACAGDLF